MAHGAYLPPSETTGQATSNRRWLLLAFLIGAGILNYVDRQIIAILKPVIEKDLGWTDADYGTLAALFQFSAAVAFAFTGWIVDRLGARLAAPVGVAAWSLAAMAHGVAVTFGQFGLARVALGATESMGTPAGIKALRALFNDRMRSLAVGISNGAPNIGAVATPLLLPLLAAAVGWRASFVIVGAAGFVWVAAWFAVSRKADLPHEPAQAKDKGQTLAMLRDRRTWGLAGAKALSDQVWWLMLFWAPDFFHRVFDLTMAQLGPALAGVYGLAALGSIAAGWIGARLLARGWSLNAVRKTSMLVCALLVLPVPLAVLAQSHWIAVGLLGLTLAAHQGFSVNIFATITDVIPARRIGAVTSFGALCGNFAGMGIVYLAGKILTGGHGYLPLLLIAAASYLVALAWLQLWLPRLQPAEDDHIPLAPAPSL
jgi:ACS family hexuronate transporter-like MFS transporter